MSECTEITGNGFALGFVAAGCFLVAALCAYRLLDWVIKRLR
jgi:hypothetical protein